jgi:hypothetical protein
MESAKLPSTPTTLRLIQEAYFDSGSEPPPGLGARVAEANEKEGTVKMGGGKGPAFRKTMRSMRARGTDGRLLSNSNSNSNSNDSQNYSRYELNRTRHLQTSVRVGLLIQRQ